MNARALARRVLGRVDEGAYATLALGGELERARGLSPADRRLTTELVYGVLRWRLRLDFALSAYAPRGLSDLNPLALNALRMGAYQILFLRVPAHAAVDYAVETVKKARSAKLAGFVNAILRRLARDGEPSPPGASDTAENLSVVHSMPVWLVRIVIGRFDHETTAALLGAFNEPAPLWLRTNSLRGTRAEIVTRLQSERAGLRCAESEIGDEAVRVDAAEEIFRTESFARGEFLAQDLAAQLIGYLADPRPGETILDACAGVGGKSTHLAALTKNAATVFAADQSERKLALLADHAHRLGTQISTIQCDLSDGNAPLAPAYDRIILDAPCSGLGVLRRHPESKWRREPADVRQLGEVQRRLLDALAPRVRPGGFLIYSVCTFTEEEGPAQIRRFLEEHAQFKVAAAGEPRWKDLLDASGALWTWPHRLNSDAFFAVRLRRDS